MTFPEYMKKYLAEHPKATAEEAYRAGYMQAVSNWVNSER